MREDQSKFYNVAKIKPSITSSKTDGFYNYQYIDTNAYQLKTYYRVVGAHPEGAHESNTVVIDGAKDFDPFLRPNPSNGVFFADLRGNKSITDLMIWDIESQKRFTKKADNNIMEMRINNPGNYISWFPDG